MSKKEEASRTLLLGNNMLRKCFLKIREDKHNKISGLVIKGKNVRKSPKKI